MSLPVDTTILCKFFFQHWIGGGGGRGEVITEIERNIKSLIIFARDFNPVQKLLRQLSHCPPPQQAMLDKQYKGILSVKSFFQHLIGGWEGGGSNQRNTTKYQKSHYFCPRFQSRAKIIETTKSLPPSPHKQCWTIYYIFGQIFFQH